MSRLCNAATCVLSGVLLCVCVKGALAQYDVIPKDLELGWDGHVQLGAQATFGTTDSSAVSVRTDFTYRGERAENELTARLHHSANKAQISRRHDTGNSLTIRQAWPSSGDPGSGGWGAIITQVPWFIDGSTISFDIQTSLLTSYFSDDGAFWYTVQVYEYGTTSDTRGLIGDPSTHLLSNIATQSILIDIKPSNKKNKINPRSRGRIWVAVLSSTETLFDPLQIKIPSVRFGPDGAKPNRHRVKDINKDGIADLLLRFEVQRTGIQCGSTEAMLAGKTYDGQVFSGTDAIKTVGCH